jgi:hypothetical protein
LCEDKDKQEGRGMFEDKAANRNCTLLLSIEIVEEVGRGRGILRDLGQRAG